MDYLAYASKMSKMHPLQEDGVEGGIGHVYDSIVARGYAGRFSEGVIDMIRRRPEVKYVEQDQIVRLQSVQMDPPWVRVFACSRLAYFLTFITKGLARINHRNKLHSYNMHYVSETGESGALAYVLDTGINDKHSDFHGRADWGATYFPDEGFVDKDGHGTHVAGIIGSTTYGVAKNTIIRAVKVISPKTTGYYSNADTDYSTVIAGVQWAVEDAMEYAMTHPHAFKGAVINMSLGGGRSRAMDYASNNAVRAGMHVVVAAGNDNRDACEESPAGAELVITVGASTIDDRKAEFSNWGPCVDVFAPGEGVISTWKGSAYATIVLSGTSMASPHVAGLVAYFLSIYPHWSFNPQFMSEDTYNSTCEKKTNRPLIPMASELTPERLKKVILHLASRGKISGVPPNTPNLLIYNNMTHQHIIPDETKDDQYNLWSQI